MHSTILGAAIPVRGLIGPPHSFPPERKHMHITTFACRRSLQGPTAAGEQGRPHELSLSDVLLEALQNSMGTDWLLLVWWKASIVLST